VFVSVITGPAGPSPESLLAQISSSVLILWGDKDVFTPIDVSADGWAVLGD